MQVERYRIVLTGWVLTGFRTEDVVVELGRLFRIPQEKVWPLLAGEPSVIRRNLTLDRAERLRNKIESRGAVCVLKTVMSDKEKCLVSDQESTGILEPDLNMEATQMVMDDGPPEFVNQKYEVATDREKRGRKRDRLLLVVFILVGIAVAVTAWELFKPLEDRGPASESSSIFTLSPTKE